ncbi:MAG: phenylalanine--tRNA ligase subunit beta [Patescibacteria group bacterium]
MKVSYNWLKYYLKNHSEKTGLPAARAAQAGGKPYKLPAPDKLAELLIFNAFEVESVEKVGNDHVLDIDVLPNRAHDCLSHKGIAREIVRLLGKPIYPEKFVGHPATSKKEVYVDVKEPGLCPRYMGVVIEGVKVGESPAWIKELLLSAGQRPKNNIVDITNFVMLEIGQPLHAFDADKLAKDEKGNPTIIVRKSGGGEITLLDGKKVSLGQETLVIADQLQVIAIAGVMGGKSTEISGSTRNIIIESANFEPGQVRKTSRALAMRTDASTRFEQGITPEFAKEGILLAIEMVLKYASDKNTKVGLISDKYHRKPLPYNLKISTTNVNKLLGTKLKDRDTEKLLRQLDFTYEKKSIKSGIEYLVAVPSERLDLTIKEDLIEEIGRVYGYRNIKAIKPKIKKKLSNDEKFDKANKVREALAREGFSEIMTYAFINKGEIELENPIAEDKKFLRNNLKDGITEALVSNMRNAPLLGITDIKIFEIGTVFKKEAEEIKVAVGIANKKGNDINEYTLDEAHDKFVKSISGKTKTIKKKEVRYKHISPYPFALRDIAVFVPKGIKNDAVLKIIEKESGLLLVQKKLFDVFEKGDKVSYAFNLVFQSHEKTLSDDEVNKIMMGITKKLNGKTGWQVR